MVRYQCQNKTHTPKKCYKYYIFYINLNMTTNNLLGLF